ncbi:MAG: hypothetical protein ABIQ99_12460 [Thermoflexales bacterium]
MTPTALKRVLIADDSADDREMVVRAMPAGYFAREASTEAEASALFESEDIHIAFIDVFFELENQRANGIALGERLSDRIPVIYISDKEDRTQRALRNAKTQRLEFLDKNRDFRDRATVARKIDEVAGKYYSGIAVSFPGSETSWGNIANKLEPEPGLRAEAELELQSVVQIATHDWDESASPAVLATRLELRPLPGAGDNSVVLQMRPFSATDEPQADVVLKFSRYRARGGRADRADLDEHTQFDRYKNVIGGYGLRERRHARRCNFQAQIFAIPYFRLEQTQTYSQYFRTESIDDEGLRRIDSITTYLFDLALRPLNSRFLQADGELGLRDYYATRIKAERRLASIHAELTPKRRPSSLQVIDDSLIVQSGQAPRVLRNPARPVLESGDYACATERVSAQLRHGDFHSGNVLVDPDRLCCWYLDYESMDETHFHLVDHVEFESDVLFSLMQVDDNFELVAALVDGITGPMLAEVADVSGKAGNVRHHAQARKALTAVRAIRRCARNVLGPGSVRPYYHALMFEALRVAGKSSLEPNQRWRALVAAAVIFDKLETLYAHA